MSQLESQTFDPSLQELVRRHRMTYRIYPEWAPDAQWKQRKAGFDVELFGAADPESSSDQECPLEQAAIDASRAALRRVADWVLAGAGPEVCVSVDAFDPTLVHDKPGAWLVQLVAHVLHCGVVGRPVDEAEERYMKDVRRRLSGLGLREK